MELISSHLEEEGEEESCSKEKLSFDGAWNMSDISVGKGKHCIDYSDWMSVYSVPGIVQSMCTFLWRLTKKNELSTTGIHMILMERVSDLIWGTELLLWFSQGDLARTKNPIPGTGRWQEQSVKLLFSALSMALSSLLSPMTSFTVLILPPFEAAQDWES